MRRPHRALLKLLVVGAFALACAVGIVGARAAIHATGAPDPSVSFTTIAPTTPVTGVLDLAGTAQASAGISRVEIRVDNGPYQPVTGTASWSYSLDTTAVADGPHDLKARVTDTAGKQSWADFLIDVDNTSALQPKIVFKTPASGATIRKTITVSGRASAAAGVARVELRVDDGAYHVASGHGAWSFRLDTTQWVDGRHTLFVRVTDTAGAHITASRPIVIHNHAHQIYWGALVSGSLYGYGAPPYDMRSLTTFERHTGKKLSILAIGANWGGHHPKFPTSGMDAIRNHGSIPLYSWGSMAYEGTDQPKYRLANIIHGKFDGYIRRFALAAKAWGHPFFLRLDWEMNLSDTYPWEETVNGNHRGEFVKMWRHVHNIFTRVGATNVTWVWCPNDEYSGSIKPLSSLYPGNRYVDWTCIDGYNWGAQLNQWQTFAQVFGPTYSVVAHIAPSKPMMIGETASSEHGGSKAQWIRDALSVELPVNFRRIKALVWFNAKDKGDWQIETSRAATAAFRAGIRSKFYAANNFRLLGPGKIRPLP